MMTSVVFGATTATTTAYDLDASTFDVQTVVTGADNATRLTYVLYNGATPDENNIIYIDQKDGSSEHTFAVSDIPVADFVGSDIIANDDASDEAYAEAVGDVYKLTKGSMPGVSYVTFEDANGGVYNFDKNGVTYLPIGVDVTAKFFTAAGTQVATVAQNGVALSTSGNTAQLASSYAVNAEVTLTATVTDAAAGSFVAVDDEYIVDEVAKTVTFLVSSTNVADVTKIGLNVTISGNINTTLKDLRNASSNETFGIQITDTNELGLVDGNEFDVTVSYDGVALDLVAGTNYYVID
jgi:hypothetical protein